MQLFHWGFGKWISVLWPSPRQIRLRMEVTTKSMKISSKFLTLKNPLICRLASNLRFYVTWIAFGFRTSPSLLSKSHTRPMFDNDDESLMTHSLRLFMLWLLPIENRKYCRKSSRSQFRWNSAKGASSLRLNKSTLTVYFYSIFVYLNFYTINISELYKRLFCLFCFCCMNFLLNIDLFIIFFLSPRNSCIWILFNFKRKEQIDRFYPFKIWIRTIYGLSLAPLSFSVDKFECFEMV